MGLSGTALPAATAALVCSIALWIASAAARPIPLAEEPPSVSLREAIEAMEAGHAAEAEAQLAQIAARHPVIADYALLISMQSRVESGRSATAIAMQAEWDWADSPLSDQFYTWLGRAYASLGGERAARDAWKRAIDASDDNDKLAALHASIAASFERTEHHEAAAAEYLVVWTRYPLTSHAAIATTALDALEEYFSETLRTPTAYRKRGDALYRLRRNQQALAAYDRALAGPLSSAVQRRRAQRKRAQTLFRLRRYPEAAAAFQQLPADDETAIEIARAYARSGSVPRAIRELISIGKRRSRHAVRANFLAGLLADGEGQHERARELFDKTIRRGAGTSYAAAAVWRLGWSAYREGRFTDAIRQFDRLIDPDGTLPSLRPRYWRARASEHAGATGTDAAYTQIAAEFPFSYYGWRAAQHLESGLHMAASEPIAPGALELGPSQLARPRILIAAGMVEAAHDEITRLSPRAKGLADRLAVAQLYSETGDFHSAERLMVAGYQTRLAARPAPQDLDVWWHAWPAPYDAELHRTAKLGVRVEPGLVYAVMREESGYLADVVSVSGARGLLQIMPETGERLARRVSLAEFSADDLFVPDVNIHLGSAYLQELLAQFDGRTSAAVASYNAGPVAVRRWLETGPGADDEWVEAIPYDQTRTYVKRVLRSLHVYRVLY